MAADLKTPSRDHPMAALMVVSMTISDESWTERYFAEVPKLLAEYGAVSVAGARDIRRVEGVAPAPDRMAVLSFPSLAAIDRFLADERYQTYRTSRERGSASHIFVFENAATCGELV